MQRKLIVVLLIIALLVPPIGTNSSYAINSQQEFFDYLDSQGIEQNTEAGRVASYDTYKKYNLVVYGDPWGDLKGTEHRYLGYDVNDQAYTNPNFPPDVGGTTPPENWNYVQVPDPTPSEYRSWELVNDAFQRQHMQTSILTGNGATQSNFTVNYIGGQSYARVQSASTWKSSGSIFTQNRGNDGKIYYATFSTPPMVGNTLVTGSLTTSQTTYTIKANENSINIPITVTANAAITGAARASHVAEITAEYMTAKETRTGQASVTLSRNLPVNRDTYATGTHTINLQGSVSLQTKFNDTDSTNVSRTITLIVEEKGDDPYVTATAEATPSTKKFDNQDVSISLKVDGTLHNYKDTSNIKEWVFYAREKEQTEARMIKDYSKSLSSSKTFKFIIPKSKVTGENFTQEYVVRARAFFITPVEGKEYYDAPAETSVYIYKENEPAPPPILEPEPAPGEPAPPPNQPPVANISAPSSVMAGEYVFISGAGSYDTDGTITEYMWSTPNSNGSVSGISGSVWYSVSSIGSNLISLTVVGDRGASDSTSRTIQVTEPIPIARVSITGTLKENRKVNINTTSSYSPTFYLLDNTKTAITITPINGGTAEDIKYSGVLTGVNNKDVLFKKAGEYQIDVYVENTAGYSNTTTSTITIQPDLPPIADFSTVTTLFRDPANNNKARIVVNDKSYSADNDVIQKRVWYLFYDSDNNGEFDNGHLLFDDLTFSHDEIKTVTQWGQTIDIKINKLGDYQIIFEVEDIGKYLVELKAIEEFGQPTIVEFVTDADKRKGTTWE